MKLNGARRLALADLAQPAGISRMQEKEHETRLSLATLKCRCEPSRFLREQKMN